MKEIDLNIFDNLDEASIWLEDVIGTRSVFLNEETQTLRGEISFIGGRWRVGVIVEDKQMEFDYDYE